jgi:hypothetical protein
MWWRKFTPVVLLASATYSIVAALSFLFIFGPFSAPGVVVWAAIFIIFVTTPFALLYLAYRKSSDNLSSRVTSFIGLVCAAISGLAYFASFGPSDGEYAIVYFAAPVLQLPLVIVAFAVKKYRASSCASHQTPHAKLHRSDYSADQENRQQRGVADPH